MLDESRLVVIYKSYDKLLIDSILKPMSDAIWSDSCKIVIISQRDIN